MQHKFHHHQAIRSKQMKKANNNGKWWKRKQTTKLGSSFIYFFFVDKTRNDIFFIHSFVHSIIRFVSDNSGCSRWIYLSVNLFKWLWLVGLFGLMFFSYVFICTHSTNKQAKQKKTTPEISYFKCKFIFCLIYFIFEEDIYVCLCVVN